MMANEYRVVVLGMGYVGLTLASVYASTGFSVLGVDINKKVVSSLKERKPHFHENGLTELLEETKDNLFFSTTILPKDKKTIFVIAVGTSLDDNGIADYSQVEQSVIDISKVISNGDIVILRSTVVAGTTRKQVIPALEKMTNFKVGEDIFVGFAPERTVEGKAIEELRTLPQIVAATSKEGEKRIIEFFEHVSEDVVPVNTLETAEMVKLISNAYRDITFAFANSVALVAADHNVDVQTLIKVANHGYKRNHIPLPSPGVGGYCLTKDPYLFAESGPSVPAIHTFMKAGRKINNAMPSHVASIVKTFIQKHDIKEPKVAIAGLAFKGEPATSDVRFSPSMDVITALQSEGVTDIVSYDPHVSKIVFEQHQIGQHASLVACANESDVIIFMHGSEHYVDGEVIEKIKTRSGTQLLVDTWNLYKDYNLSDEDGIVYANLSYKSG